MADNTAFLEDSAADAIDAISRAASDAKRRAGRMGQAVVDKVDETRDVAASALHEASESLHGQAQHLPAPGQKLAHSAADRL